MTDVVRTVRNEGGTWKFTPKNLPCDPGAFQLVVEIVLEAKSRGYLVEVVPHRARHPSGDSGDFDVVVASRVTDEGHQHLVDMGFPPDDEDSDSIADDSAERAPR